MEDIDSFDQTLKHMLIYLTQVEDTLILFGVTDDTVLRDHVIKVLRERLPEAITLRDFRYDREHISLLEGVVKTAASSNGRVVVSVTGLEALPRDKQSEAIKLLNYQRNRFGRTGLAVIVWVNQALFAEIANKAADFYSWRSHTFFIEPPPDWNKLESLRRSYLQALLYQNEYVNLQGLAPMRGGQIVQMRMDQIFIPLRVEQEVSSSPVESFLQLGDKKEGGEPEERSPEEACTWERYAPERRELPSRPVEIPELLRERRAVVLGDPGAGKTTLLRYVAYQLANAQISGTDPEFAKQTPHLANCLPVYVRIGLYAQHLEQSPEATIAEYAPLGCQLFQLPLTAELLKAEMEQGRVLFLLDGLDEIIDTTWRREVAQRVEAFTRSWPYCPVVVTSRIVGYREARLGDLFMQFTISPFAEQEIRCFAESWYRALGEPGRAAALVDGILASDSIRRLASNPLLLTVIALIHFRRTKLPHQRVKLYQLAAETLVDQWMSERRVIPEEWNVSETLNVLLPAIAWYLHRTTSSGLLGEQYLHELLVKTLRHHEPRLSGQDTHRRAAQFRRNVAEFSGIFLERGLDKDGRGLYGFLHLTFEEYFAAVRLGELWDREGSQVLKPLLHDPRWVEITLLAAGRFGEFSQYQATRFVRAILDAGSEYEDILHRDLLLAARCLGDDVRVDADLRRTILTQLLKLYFNSQSPSALCEDIGKAFARLGSTAARADLLETLMKKLSATDGFVRAAAVRALGQLGAAAAIPEMLTALLKLFPDTEESVRAAAAIAMGQLGQVAVKPEEVFVVLLKHLSDTNEYVRAATARAVGQLGPAAATPQVLAALLQRLSDPDGSVRWAAAGALGQLGPAAATPQVLATLLQLLFDTNGSVRAVAACALGQLGAVAATPQVLAALLQRLSDPDGSVRWAAAGALGRLGPAAATPEVLTALLQRLSALDRSVQAAVAVAVGQLGQVAVKSEEVLAVLLKRLSDIDIPDIDRFVCWAAAVAVGPTAATPEVLAVLLKRLSGTDEETREAAAHAVGQLGQAAATPDVLAVLLQRLSDTDEYMRAATALAVGQLGPAAATPEVLAALLQRLSDTERLVRWAAARAVGNLSAYVRSQDRSQVVKLLLPLATNKKDKEEREAGYIALRNLLAAEASD